MNRRWRKRIITLVVAFLMLGVLQVINLTASATDGEITEIVSNSPQLYSAIDRAEDGDVIGIDDSISIGGNMTLGHENKHITIKRMNDYANIIISRTPLIDVAFKNMTIDGNGFVSSEPLITSRVHSTFENVTFKNAINEWGEGGAVSILGGSAYFNHVTFDNNKAYRGGHLNVGTDAAVEVENSIFINGYADIEGGAIKNYTDGFNKLIIRDSIITENEAGRYGGGISNSNYLLTYDTKIYNNHAPDATTGIAEKINAGETFSFD